MAWFKKGTKVIKKYPPNRIQVYVRSVEVHADKGNGYGTVTLCVTQTDEDGKLTEEKDYELQTGSLLYWEKKDSDEN